MAGWLSLVLLTWGLRGSVGLSSLPQAVTDSTQEVAFSPYFQITVAELFPGLRLEGSGRGLSNDPTRAGYAAWRLTTASLTYAPTNLPFSLKLGRQFSFFHLGGWLDGFTGAVRLGKWEIRALGGKRVPPLYASKERFFSPETPTILGLQLRSPRFRTWRLWAGYGQEREGDSLRSAPLWGGFAYTGGLHLRGELALDLTRKWVSRAFLSAYGRWSAARWSLAYRYTDPWYALELLGIQDRDPDELSRPLHRAEGSLQMTRNGLRATVGTWIALSETRKSPTLWLQIGTQNIRFFGWAGKEPEGWQKGGVVSLTYPLAPALQARLSGRLVDSPRWPTRWIGSLRFGLRGSLPFGAILTGEIRLWENPEVNREVQGYLGLTLPFEWRSSS